MREIKFRIWDLDKKMFINEDECEKNKICAKGEKYDHIQYIVIGLDGSVYYEWHDGVDIQSVEAEVILEEYTGLKDKNGVELYECDIVKVEGICYGGGIGTVKIGEYYQDGSGDEYSPVKCCGTYVKLEKTFWSSGEEREIQEYEETNSILNFETFEIIGNIHEEESK